MSHYCTGKSPLSRRDRGIRGISSGGEGNRITGNALTIIGPSELASKPLEKPIIHQQGFGPEPNLHRLRVLDYRVELDSL